MKLLLARSQQQIVRRNKKANGLLFQSNYRLNTYSQNSDINKEPNCFLDYFANFVCFWQLRQLEWDLGKI